MIPAGRALSRIYASENRHAALAEILRVEVRLEDNVETRRALYERIGNLYETMLADPQKAIEAWRARIGDDPTDATALGALERLYERTEEWRELVGVLHAREQSTLDQSERRRTMVRSAEILASGGPFSESDEVLIEALGPVLQGQPGDAGTEPVDFTLADLPAQAARRLEAVRVRAINRYPVVASPSAICS